MIRPTRQGTALHRPSWLLVLIACALSAPSLVRPQSAGAPGAPLRATANDNTQAAGILKDGVLSVHLVAQQVTWHPEAEDGPTQVVTAFGSAGQAPSVPGPLIRIPLGTAIDVTVTNSLPDTLVVLGLRGRNDSLRIAPNGVEKLRYKPPIAGSFLYAGSDVRDGKIRFGGTYGQLVGGLIVDAGPPPKDRIFISTAWDPVPIAGNPYFLAMNGKSWPYTETFVHTVGDTVRWRVLNGGDGTSAHHPMHLHGFYYRVDARGAWDADTLYEPGQQRWVVTENLPGLASMSMTWVPTRPGNWLFHCHNADHVAGRHRHMIAGRERPYPAPPLHDPQEHLAWDMAGLAHAITILPRASQTPAEARAATPRTPTARSLRLLIQARPRFYGPGPGFGYVLQDGATEPAADSINVPGPQLVLRRDEPVEITVVNRLPTHTTVHWHGIELESFYDGIAGWSGAGDQRAPMLAPRDSFVVRFTPPRAGTFIYHAHVTDHVQLARGLYGALIVAAPDRPLLPGTDHVAIVGLGRPNGRAGLLVNGSVSPAPLERRRQGPQRIRLINISPENNVIFTLSADSTLMRWRATAKDGFDLSAAQRRMLPASVQVFPGETYDFEFESAADVVRLRMKNPAAGPGVDDVTLLLRAKN